MQIAISIHAYYFFTLCQNKVAFTFYWGKTEKRVAHLVAQRNGVYVKFRWEDESPNTYFEMRISYNELTRENTLEVTDFADKGETEDQKELWNSQIENLRRQSGM